MSKYICGAVVDIGVERESQEDYVQYREFGDNLFCVVADGAGSQKGFSQPAVIVVSDILETLTEIYGIFGLTKKIRLMKSRQSQFLLLQIPMYLQTM